MYATELHYFITMPNHYVEHSASPRTHALARDSRPRAAEEPAERRDGRRHLPRRQQNANQKNGRTTNYPAG